MIFVGDLPDLTRAPRLLASPSSQVTRERIADFNRRIARVAAETGCILVRLSNMTIEPDIFASDGFHPNNKGYQMLTDCFLAEIEPRL
jgi:lysophospholipase L1-like esterase